MGGRLSVHEYGPADLEALLYPVVIGRVGGRMEQACVHKRHERVYQSSKERVRRSSSSSELRLRLCVCTYLLPTMMMRRAKSSTMIMVRSSSRKWTSCTIPSTFNNDDGDEDDDDNNRDSDIWSSKGSSRATWTDIAGFFCCIVIFAESV